MKKIFIWVLLCTWGMYSQELPTIIPPSPEAASLGKFGEIPVSLYTGLPSVGIPIYTIQESGVSIPISLSYHARGVQVGEVAPRVGLGWALSFGGSLSRQIRDAADESTYGYFNNSTLLKDAPTQLSARGALYTQDLLYPNFDMVPDKFILSANGTSGNFIFDYTNQQPLLQQFDNVRIIPQFTGTAISGFIVTDAKGVTYYFGKSKDGRRTALNTETTLISYTYSDPNGPNQTGGGFDGPFPNAWQLMDIETPQGNLIEFHYQWEELTYVRKSFDKENKIEDVYVNESHFSKIRSAQYQISEIRFNTGTVKFIKSASQRQDIDGGYTLDRVEVLNKNNTLIKKVQFGYQYKTGVTNGNELPYLLSLDAKATKRLYLTSVQEVNASGSALPAHRFSYSTQELPNRFSTSQDAWGYYNGANNGRYLTFFNNGIINIDRTVDTLKSMAGMLTNIQYPTGGSTHFTYEHNKVIPDASIKDLVTSAVNPLVSRNEGLSHLEYATHYNPTTRSYEKQFTVGDVFNNDMSWSVSFDDTLGCTTNEPECKFEVTVSGEGEYFAVYLGSNQQIGLAPGTYTLRVRPTYRGHDPFAFGHGFMVNVNWLEQSASESEIMYGGGKRIQRIEHRDSDGSVVSFKAYDYTDTNGISSGRLFGLPNFYSVAEMTTFSGAKVLEYHGSVPGSPLSVAHSNSIGYNTVTEYIGDATQNIGKTINQFTYIVNGGDSHVFPYTIPTDQEWLRGKLYLSRQYKNTNGSYSLVKRTENTYLNADNPVMSLLPTIFSPETTMNNWSSNLPPWLGYSKSNSYYRLPLIEITHEKSPLTGLPDPLRPLIYKAYHLTGGTHNLWKTDETLYDESGKELTTHTEYHFNYAQHYQIAEQTFQDSFGATLKTTYQYPSSGYLFNTHQWIPLEVATYKNTSLLSKVKTDYAYFGSQYLPQKVATAKGTGSLEDRVVYHRYDSKGNPLEVSKKDGASMVYLWGYNKSRPIAKIENATFGQVAAALGISETSLLGYSERNLAQINTLRTCLPSALVTTLSYLPLVGIQTVTDPRGDTTYYEYDSFHRLQYVKDKNQKLLSETQYHFKN